LSTSFREAGASVFDDEVVLKIFAPKGTKCAYVEPISRNGNGLGRDWDGVEKQWSFGGELEGLLNCGMKMLITGAQINKAGKVALICELL